MAPKQPSFPTLQSDYKKTIHFDCQFPTYAEAFDHAKNAREIFQLTLKKGILCSVNRR